MVSTAHQDGRTSSQYIRLTSRTSGPDKVVESPPGPTSEPSVRLTLYRREHVYTQGGRGQGLSEGSSDPAPVPTEGANPLVPTTSVVFPHSPWGDSWDPFLEWTSMVVYLRLPESLSQQSSRHLRCGHYRTQKERV